MYTTVEIAAYDITLFYIFMLFIILFHVYMTQKHAPNTGLSLSLSLSVYVRYTQSDAYHGMILHFKLSIRNR